MFSSRSVLAATFACLVTCVLANPAFAQQGPESRAPFSLSARELLAVQSPARPAGLDVEVLLTDWTYEFDGQQRKVTRLHRVFRLLTQRGVENWGSLAMPYAAWHQDKPRVRARVVHSDGSEHWLNEATLIDGAPRAQEGLVHSDQREITGPFPALRRDCVVELLIEKSEHQPLFDAGSTFSVYFDVSTYTRMQRVRVSAPESITLRHHTRGGALRVAERRERGRRHLEVVQRDLLPFSEYPAVSTPETALAPVFHFSTGQSWGHVAKAYAAQVERALEGFNAQAIANGLVEPGDAPAVKAQKIADYLRHQVRYTGLELGERSLLPESPPRVLERHYGDCKDLSTLMVALLRAVGVSADVALLQTGPGLDTAPQLPGLGAFDHAIVHVTSPELWIDPTNPNAPVGTLPFGDQDRLSLIANQQARQLVRIPASVGDANGYRELVTIDLADDGKPTVVETTSAWGAVGASLRAQFDRPSDAIKEDLKEYMVQRYGASISDVSTENVRDVSQSFVLTITGTDAERYESRGGVGYASAAPVNVYSYLPKALSEPPPVENRHDNKRNQVDPRTREPSKLPVYINAPHKVELTYVFTPPPGFRWDDLPADLSQQAHGIAVSRTTTQSDNRLTISFAVLTNTRVVAPEHVLEVQRMLQQFDENSTVQVRFRHAAAQLIEDGKLAEGMRMYRELISATPSAPQVARRYAGTLIGMHLGTDARAVVKQLIARDGGSADSHAQLGYIHLFDQRGREDRPGADLLVAERAYRKAMELDADEPAWRRVLAILLKQRFLYDPQRPRALLEESVRLLQELRDDFGERESDDDLMIGRFMLEQYDDVIALAPQVDANVSQRNPLWVGAIAMTQGRAAAERKAVELAPGDPTALLNRAVSLMLVFERYAPVRDLLELPRMKANGDPSRRLREEVTNTVDPARCAKHEPAAAALYAWRGRLQRSEVDVQAAVEEMKNRARGSYFDAISVRDIARELAPTTPGSTLSRRVDAAVTPCNERTEIETAGDVVRVRRFDRATNAREGVYLMLQRGREFALLGSGGRYVLSSRLIMNALKQRREADARKLVAWYREHNKDQREVTNHYAFADALRALLPTSVDQASVEDMTLFAAALGVSERNGDVELNTLRARLASETVPARKLAITYLLAQIALQKRDVGALALLRQTHELRPDDVDLWASYIYSRLDLGQIDGIDADIAAFSVLDEERAWLFGAYARVDRGEWDALRQYMAARQAENKVTSLALNNISWRMWERRQQLDYAIELAEQSVRLEENENNLHTLGTLFVEVGRVDDAYREMKKIFDKHSGPNSPWQLYTLGRIAEDLGLVASARFVYQEIERGSYEGPRSVWTATQARLERLPRVR